MLKRLFLEIDTASWNSAPAVFRKPCPFVGQPNSVDVDLLRALLWLGTMSVSVRMPNWWFASQWAQIRYVAATDLTVQELRLHAGVDDLDTHQKKVLSDDWGIAFALEWLSSQFLYAEIAPASLVMRDLQRRGIASFVSRKKRGPEKCPDFIATDSSGLLHLIECKGNQQGPRHTRDQFQRGRQQKQNVRFANEALVGQRLLTGLAIAGASSKWSSIMRVADPPPPDQSEMGEGSYFEVNAITVEPITESIKKGRIIQDLMLAGALDVAKLVYAIEMEAEGLAETIETARDTFETRGKHWRGPVYEMKFPVAIGTHRDGGRIIGCRLRYGISTDLEDRLTGSKSPDPGTMLSSANAAVMRGAEGRPNQANEYAFIQHGDLFLADLTLLGS